MNLLTSLPHLALTQESIVYMVGIKGVGMTALATLLHEAGVQVLGADVLEEFVTDASLARLGIEVQPFATAHIPAEVSVVVYSGAHQGKQNPLVQSAIKAGKTVLNLAQAVGILSQERETIAVCGVGGKSTTSALLSWIFTKAGHHPSYSVGVGNIPNLGQSGHWSPDSRWFIVEADEYVADPKEDLTPRFMYLRPQYAIATSLRFDHPDVYASPQETEAAFAAFFRSLPESGVLVYNGDDDHLHELVQKTELAARTISVGEEPHNDVRITQMQVEEQGTTVWLDAGMTLHLTIPGFHNARNAVYAAVLSKELGVERKSIQEAITEFRSTQRRFEFRGVTPSGVVCYDDYAHHPHELEAMASTLRTWFPAQKCIIVFQPHTFSRTRALFVEFVRALKNQPGEVWILPIFASAREAFDDGVTSEQLVEAVQQAGGVATFVPDQATLLEWVQDLEGETVLLTTGAGDIYQLYDQLTFLPTA